MQSYHSMHTPLRRAVSFSHYPNEQVMAGATPYVGPQEIYPLAGPGSYSGGLGLNGMGMASPYMAVPPGGYIEPGNLGSPLSGDFPSSPSNIVPLSSQDTGMVPPIALRPPSPNINIDDTPGTHHDRFPSDSYDEYEDGYTQYGTSPYARSRRMSSASRYYPEYDDYSRYDHSPHHYSSRYYDRSPHHYSSSRYYDRDRYDRYSRYGRGYDRRYYDGYSSRYSSSGHRGPKGESLMYRRTTSGDVQVLRNGRESIGDKFRRAMGLDPKGVHVVRLKQGESLAGPGRYY